MNLRPLYVLGLLLPLVAAFTVACSSGQDEDTPDAPSAPAAETATTVDSASAPQAAPPPEGSDVSAAPGAYLTFNQVLVEGFRADGVDLEQPASVFATVFAGLPDEVIVYPSERGLHP